MIGLTSCLVSTSLSQPIVMPQLTIPVHTDEKKTTEGHTVTFSKKKIAAYGQISTTQLLSQQASLQVTQSSSVPNQQGIGLAGFGANAASNTLLLINGSPLGNATGIPVNLNHIMIETIDHIRLLTGSYGVWYGSQAVGGVVNLSLTPPADPHTDFTLGWGNLSQRSARLFVSRPLDKNNRLALSAMADHITHRAAQNKQSNAQVNLLYSHDSTQHHSRLTGFLSQWHVDVPQGQIWGNPTPPAHSDSNTTHRTGYINIEDQYDAQPNVQWATHVSAYRDAATGFFRVPFDSTQHTFFVGERLRYRKHFEAGIEGQGAHYQFHNTASEKQAGDLSLSGFVRQTIPLSTHWHGVVGGRYALQTTQVQFQDQPRINSHSNLPVYEAGLFFQLKPNTALYVRTDRNYRFAKADERSWTVDNARTLQTQTGQFYALGIDHTAPHHHLKAELFQLGLQHELAYDPQPSASSPFGKISNLDPTLRLGINFTDDIPLNNAQHLQLQGNWVHARFQSGPYAGAHIPMVSSLHASAGYTYHWNTRTSLQLIEQYRSAFYAANDTSNAGPMMPGYFLTHLQLIHRWSAYRWQLSVNNLFNRHYVQFADYFSTPTSTTYFYAADGINIMLQLSVALGA